MNKSPTLYQQLNQIQDGQRLNSMADQFGLTIGDAQTAFRTIMPSLTKALGRNISTDAGLVDLLNALATGDHAKYLDAPDIFAKQSVKEDGNAILGHLLGNKRESRALAARASAGSGIAEIIIRQILPYLASLLMAWLSKQGQGGSSGRGGGFGGGYPSSGGSQDLSEVLEDLSNITQRKTGGTPSSAPDRSPYSPDRGSDHNPYREISDVIREDGPGSKTIAGKIRDALGSAIGSGGKGIIGWILSAIIWRYGWRIARYFLKRIF